MNTFQPALLALCATLCTSPALADPTTYSGRLGDMDIVVELSADPAKHPGPVFGRYLYLGKGVDIPLQARSRDGAALALSEEGPCGEANCGNGQTPPVAAVWTLEVGEKGRLAGVWKGERELRLELSRQGSRFEPAAPATPLDLFRHSEDLSWNGDPITLASEPYDHLRLDVPQAMSDPLGWSDARFSFATDPRIGYAAPRIAEIAGGSPDAANALLEQRHRRDSLSAFACAALQYAGFSEDGSRRPAGSGSFGGWDTDAWAEVVALTPKLMSWNESGSRFCGGAHPYNYSNSYTMDVAAGALLSLGDMFEDAQDDRPGETLVAFVRDTRERPAPGGVDARHEEECGTDELIAGFLSASLRRDGDELRLVFGLERLPHAIHACGDEVLDLPVAAAGHLMTPRFAALVGL